MTKSMSICMAGCVAFAGCALQTGTAETDPNATDPELGNVTQAWYGTCNSPDNLTVRQSYWSAFGREPTSNEMAYWCRSATGPNLTAHSQWLRSGDYWAGVERVAVIKRTYQAAFGRQPGQNEINWWNAEILRNGEIYEEILVAHYTWASNLGYWCYNAYMMCMHPGGTCLYHYCPGA